MVQRQSEAPSFLSRQLESVSQAAAGAVRPDANTSSSRTIQIDDGSTRVLQGLLGTADKLANQYIDRQQEEAYLQGASKVGQIQSEDELQGNPLTRDWTVAGFRDTTGRLKLADAESQLKVDMKSLREQSPEKFQEYLAQRRPDLVAAMSGMSYEQRKATFGNMLISETAATKLHTAEHAKFIVETEQKSIQASTATAIQSLTDARNSGSTEAYTGYRSAVVGILQKDILLNPKLPADIKQGMTKEYLEALLASGNVEAYEYLNTTPILNPDGKGSSPIVGRLGLEDQAKLSTKYQEAVNKLTLQRNTQFFEEKAKAEAAMQAGNYDWTYEQAKAFADHGVRTGAFREPGQYEGFLQRHLEYQWKYKNSGAIADAAERGDVQQLVRMGKNESEAVDALVTYYGKEGASVPQIVGRLMNSGNAGLGRAYAKAGELLAPSFRNLMASKDGKLDAQHAAMVEGIHNALSAAETSGNTGATAQFLSAMPEDVRLQVERVRNLMKGGRDITSAIVESQKLQQTVDNMSPQAKAAVAGQNSADDTKFLGEFKPIGLFTGLGLSVKQFIPGLSTEAQAKLEMLPSTHWFQQDNIVSKVTADARLVLQQELDAVNQSDPYLPSEARQKVALGAAASRTIKTELGPVFLPKGATAQGFFGVRDQDKALIGDALDSVMRKVRAGKPEVGDYQFTALDGELRYTAYDKDGVFMQSDRIDPKLIADEVQAIKGKRTADADKSSGAGVTLSTGAVPIKFNGVNGAGLDNGLMLQFRENLVHGEGVINRVQSSKTSRGADILTVGVGVSERSDFWPKGLKAGDVVPQDVLESSFMNASNAAARDGAAIVAQLPNSKALPDSVTLLASELSYHAGRGHVSQEGYPDMYAAIVRKDKDAAVQAFRKTQAFVDSGPARRRHYESLISQSTR